MGDFDNRIFPSPGRCIYCGATSFLSDEHIIPASLGGSAVIERASCNACANETHAFEGYCASKVFRSIRLAYGIKGRRRKRPPPPTHLPLTTGDSSDIRTTDVPIEEHPLGFSLPMFEQAGILQYRAPGEDFKIRWCYGMKSPSLAPAVYDSLFERNQKEIGESITLHFVGQIRLNPYARLIAKISHCATVALVGLDKFKPYLMDIILRASPDFHYYVGGSLEKQPESEKADITFNIFDMKHPSGHFVICQMRMFADIGGPLYEVVVGELV